MLGVNGNHIFRSWGKPLMSPARPRRLPRPLSRPTGSACRQEYGVDDGSLWTRGLLIRRTIADGDPTSPSSAPLEPRSRRWARSKAIAKAIEDSFETAKNEFGLDRNETRSRHGWRRELLPVGGQRVKLAQPCPRTPWADVAQRGMSSPSIAELSQTFPTLLMEQVMPYRPASAGIARWYIAIPGRASRLGNRYATLRNQLHSLNLELIVKLPSRHVLSPVPASRAYPRVHQTGSSSK